MSITLLIDIEACFNHRRLNRLLMDRLLTDRYGNEK